MVTMRRRVSLPLFYAFAVCLVITCGCQSPSGAWPRIEKSGVLRVGLDPTYPPFEVVDDNGLYGLDIDLVHAAAKGLGLDVEFVYFGYDGLYDALATNQVDVLVSALVPIPGRTRDFAYSEPYFNAGEILIIPVEEDITGIEQMDGRLLAVELGAQGHVEATQWAKQLPNLIIQPYNSVEEALLAVANNEADAALVDHVSGRLFLKDQATDSRRLKRLPEPVTVEPYVFVVRIEDEILLKNLNQALKALIDSSELERIVNNWLDS